MSLTSEWVRYTYVDKETGTKQAYVNVIFVIISPYRIQEGRPVKGENLYRTLRNFRTETDSSRQERVSVS
jgi:hypothetical protein